MTSLQPISPKSDDSTNPPPRKRRKDDGGEDKDGKNVDASIDDDLFGDGDCGGVNPTIDEAEDEVYYAELTQAQSQDKDPFVCVPCDSRIPRMLKRPHRPLGGGHCGTLHDAFALQELVSSVRQE